MPLSHGRGMVHHPRLTTLSVGITRDERYMSGNEKTVTVWGRLSFPAFTAQEAYEGSQRGSYPAKDVASASPNFLLVLNDVQWEKFRKHCVDVFLPYCEQQHKKGEKKDAMSTADVKKLIEAIEDPANASVNTPAKVVGEKTLALAPEGVMAVKCIGGKGTDIQLKTIVSDESELAVPDPDILSYPVIKPIGESVHEMYPGANVAATLNLYAYFNGKNPGFSAGASIAVFRSDNDRFGGSIGVDESEIFMD